MLTTAERFRAYLLMIEQQEHDSPAALELRNKLESVKGVDHPDLRRADVRIRQIAALKAMRTTDS